MIADPVNQTLTALAGRSFAALSSDQIVLVGRIASLAIVLLTAAVCVPLGTSHSFLVREAALIVAALQMVAPFTWYLQLVMLHIPLFVTLMTLLPQRRKKTIAAVGLLAMLSNLHGLFWRPIADSLGNGWWMSTPLFLTLLLWACLATDIVTEKQSLRRKTAPAQNWMHPLPQNLFVPVRAYFIVVIYCFRYFWRSSRQSYKTSRWNKIMSTVSLVTGGAGFIGSHVVDELIALGHQVLVLDDLSGGFRRNIHPAAQWIEGSITDVALVDRLFDLHRIDYVYHLAAYAAEGLSHFIKRYNYTNNLLGSVNLINASVNHAVKCFVFTSSIAVYGAAQLPMHEETTPQPEDPYGIAKYAVELDLAESQAMFGLPYVMSRSP